MPPAHPSAPHSRTHSTAGHQRTDSRAEKKTTKQPDTQVQYTLLIRLPFPRGDFVDPPQVSWDAAKDQALWEVISRSSKTSDLDWQELASTFDVPHPFLLQQAAWLYERHLSHVRAQMRKVAPASSFSPVPTGQAGGTAPGSTSMRRLGSGGAGASTTQSSLPGRSQRDSARYRTSMGDPTATGGTSRPSGLSRNPSTATVTQSRHVRAQEAGVVGEMPPSPRQTVQQSLRYSTGRPSSGDAQQQGSQNKAPRPSIRASVLSPAASSPASSDSESSSSEDVAASTAHGLRRSQLVPHRPTWRRSQNRPLGTLEDTSGDAEDDEDDETSLPFAAKAAPAMARPRTSTTMTTTHERPRTSIQQPALQTPEEQGAQASSKGAYPQSLRSTSGPTHRKFDPSSPPADAPAPSETGTSASSAASLPHAQQDGPYSSSAATGNAGRGMPRRSPGVLSPQHRAELARRLSPRRAGTADGGSEGAPSMGSSFSDLDDASVSRSEIESMLRSNMQDGSRVSAFGQLRSKYL